MAIFIWDGCLQVLNWFPILFLLYISDIPEMIGNKFLFADDVKLVACRSKIDNQFSLQHTLM